jgi:ABC-2 type transport system permease protein
VIGNRIGLWTIIKRELQRTRVVINQVVWPPLITTLLYLFVFGLSLGSRITEVEGLPYLTFLLPGLVMMSVIEGAYGEASSSLFQLRFTNAIQELLIAPLSAWEIVCGFVVGSIFRGLIIANLVMLCGAFILGVFPQSWLLYLVMLVLVCTFFASLGLVMGLWADKYDHIAILTTFFITPLVYFGGVFHSVSMLPAQMQAISYANPLFYMIDGFRYAMTGHSLVEPWLDVALVAVLALASTSWALVLFARGYRLRA